MDNDTTLVVGLVLGVLAIPSIVSALSEGRAPRVAAIVAMVAGGLMVWAINGKAATGSPYRFQDLPDVVYRVIGGLFG